MKEIFKKFFAGLVALFVTLVLLACFLSLYAPRNSHIEYGITFSAPYAESLGLDWHQAYTTILDELHPKYLRLSAYWDSVEPSRDYFNFDDLDFQINNAQSRGVKVVLAVGRRLPRWPECHDPNWIGNLSKDELQTEQLSYMENVVRRYQNNSAIQAWQVENEPFLSTFGICPPLDKSFLDKEIDLVKNLDLARPVVITDSGELSFWLYSGGRGDIFGTTFYRYVFSDVFKRYWTNHIPAVFYRFKAGLLELLHPGKQIAIMELEAEPWTTAGIPNTPIDQQFKTMSLQNFNTIVSVAAQTGFTPQYLWGAEWWYYMKFDKQHPEFWDRAKQLLAQ